MTKYARSMKFPGIGHSKWEIKTFRTWRPKIKMSNFIEPLSVFDEKR